jgi:hypothetical protein
MEWLTEIYTNSKSLEDMRKAAPTAKFQAIVQLTEVATTTRRTLFMYNSSTSRLSEYSNPA